MCVQCALQRQGRCVPVLFHLQVPTTTSPPPPPPFHAYIICIFHTYSSREKKGKVGGGRVGSKRERWDSVCVGKLFQRERMQARRNVEGGRRETEPPCSASWVLPAPKQMGEDREMGKEKGKPPPASPTPLGRKASAPPASNNHHIEGRLE